MLSHPLGSGQLPQYTEPSPDLPSNLFLLIGELRIKVRIIHTCQVANLMILGFTSFSKSLYFILITSE